MMVVVMMKVMVVFNSCRSIQGRVIHFIHISGRYPSSITNSLNMCAVGDSIFAIQVVMMVERSWQ